MSIIAVEIKIDKISFAWDTRLSYADFPYSIDKVFQIKNIIIGRTGDIKTNPYLKNFIEEETRSQEISLDNEYSVANLFDKYKERFENTEGAKFVDGDSLFISDSKKVFYFHNINYTCFEITKFDAIGSGANYTIGAYKATCDLKKSVEIACDCNIYCARPIKILTIIK